MGEDKDGGRKYLNILPIKSNYDNKKEAQILKTPIPHPSLHPGLNFTSKFSTSYSQETQGYQEWGLWLDHMLYLLLLTPQGEGGPLTLFCCSRVGPLPWETALHELPQHGAFPPAEFLMNCPSMSPFRTRLLQQGTPCLPACSSVDPLFQWCGQDLLQSRLPMWLKPALGLHLLQHACRAVSLTCLHSSLLAAIVQGFFPLLLNSLTLEVLSPAVIVSTLVSHRPILEPPGIGTAGKLPTEPPL